jgi:hypothetical protein
MTTFEMAQKAYENPGKVFVGHLPPAGAQTFFLHVMWDGRNLVFLSGDCDSKFAPLDHYQNTGYVWEEERTPRKWSGEYTSGDSGGKSSGQTAYETMPDGVRMFRVKWEAEEVL